MRTIRLILAIAIAALLTGCPPAVTADGRTSSGGTDTQGQTVGPSLDDGGTAATEGETTGGETAADTTTTGGDTETGGGDQTTGFASTGGGSVCSPGETQCDGTGTSLVCNETGSDWNAVACEGSTACADGECRDIICNPGEKKAECAGPDSFLVCNETGTHWIGEQCKNELKCYKGECNNLQCEPNAITCFGFGAVQQCKSDGSQWQIIETCEKGGVCAAGLCISACDVNLKAATYRGCEYYAADLDNIEGGQFEPVAIVVSVPSTVENAEVQIVDNSTGHIFAPGELGSLFDMQVAAGSLKIFELPPGQDIDGSGVTQRSYSITTSSPATVHQFNPLNGEGVFTNDASLLLPSAAGGKLYFVMSWPQRSDEFETLRGFVTMIASEPGTTTITVTPRSDVAAGIDGSGVAAIPSGATVTIDLEQGQVLNLETDGPHGADLSGSRVAGSQRFVAFGGHECANVPLGINACDHLEQQLVPVSAWGKRYIADSFKQRSPTQFDIYRVMAGDTDVLVETNPPQKGFEQFLLQPGGFVTFSSAEHFEVKATGPISVGHFMIGSSYPGHIKTCKNTGIGDPAFTLSVPTQQFLTEYTVLTPPGYAQNFINIIGQAGSAVTVDGQPLTTPLKQVSPGLPWGVAQVPVVLTNPGAGKVTTVKANKKFGMTAYGYDCDVSYAYPGGLRLQQLTGEL